MSILLVNTLYRPDRGGATMVVDDICQHVGQKWPVFVFCGRLTDHKHPRYDVRDYTYGFSWVRSVNVTQGSYDPFTLQNYRNETIAQIFRDYLCEVEPMIVHAHSQQWLGAALIEEAKEFGVKLILTMHDWWWICPHQFLWDYHTGKICSLTRARKECNCGPRGFMKNRQDYLMRVLRLVDLITVPSQTLKDSLEANGIDFVPITVVANSVAAPRETTRPTKMRVARPVRFGYLGGMNALKGYETLVQATQGFRPAECVVKVYDPLRKERTHSSEDITGPRWRALLDVIKPRHRLAQLYSFLRHPRFLFGAVFRARFRVWIRSLVSIARGGRKEDVLQFFPAFEPSNLDQVMTGIDVLLVPSVARESFSLVTREALVRRVPVICSDCGGPTEVIHDGETGAIFRSGDAKDLQEKMRYVIDEPQVVERWKADIRPEYIPVHPQSIKEFERLHAQYAPMRPVKFHRACMVEQTTRSIGGIRHNLVRKQSGHSSFLFDNLFLYALAQINAEDVAHRLANRFRICGPAASTLLDILERGGFFTVAANDATQKSEQLESSLSASDRGVHP